jgi:hypothetical protein
MDHRIAGLSLISLVALAGVGCSSSTETSQTSNCVETSAVQLSSAADFSGRVDKVDLEDGFSPEGPLYQHDLWLTVAPGTAPNAGVVVGRTVPVFLQVGSAAPIASTACAVEVSDSVEVWHDASVIYGAAQAPPGAPAYSGTQVVIVRP